MTEEEFSVFLQNIGIGKETAAKLWAGSIRTPQKLASTKSDVVSSLVDDDPVLINTILPVLQKHAFQIAMAKDPSAKAIKLLQRHAGNDDDEDNVDINHTHTNTESDAQPFSGNQPSSQRFECHPQNAENSQNNNRQTRSSPTTVVTQGRFGEPKMITHSGHSNNVIITGGNFPQANILGSQPVIYNNTNSTICATSYGNWDRSKNRKEKVKPSFIKIQDATFSTSDFRFVSENDFWLDDLNVRKADKRVYDHQTDSLYPVKPWNGNRALLINVTQFIKAPARHGGDVDVLLLCEVLEKLGFTVVQCINKTKREIEQHIREFTSSSRNSNCSISLIYIGSHGERNSKISPREKRRLHQGSHSLQSDADADVEENETPHRAHDGADMLHAYATAAGTKAYRDTSDGSWFVTALCKVLRDHAHAEDILSMLTMVNNEVIGRSGKENGETAVQLAEVKYTLSKKVRFYPQ